MSLESPGLRMTVTTLATGLILDSAAGQPDLTAEIARAAEAPGSAN